LDQIVHIGVNVLFGREIIFEVFPPVWKNIPQHHRQTDGRTDRRTDGRLTVA